MVECNICHKKWIPSNDLDDYESLKAHLEIFHPEILAEKNETLDRKNFNEE